MADRAHSIIIRNHGSGYTIAIEPPMPGVDYSGAYNDLKRARGYASGLKFTLGLKVLDLTGEAAR